MRRPTLVLLNWIKGTAGRRIFIVILLVGGGSEQLELVPFDGERRRGLPGESSD
jgi:hypothetical protein